MLPEAFSPQFLKQLELLSIRSRRNFLGTKQGGHISPRKGHGIEFSDYRQYELGDNPRHIDWGLYARTDRLYVKRYQEEEDLTVLILIDASPSMRIPEEGNKWKKALNIAIALSYVALMNHDTVVISVLGKFKSPRYYGARAIHRIAKDLSEIHFFDNEKQANFDEDVLLATSSVKFPGVVVALSDLLLPIESIEKALNILRSKNLSISLIQILGGSDLVPFALDTSTIAVDSETNEEVELQWHSATQTNYEKRLKIHNDLIRSYCYSTGINLSQSTPSLSFDKYMLSELPRTGILV